MYPNDGFREFGRGECLRLLATAPVGRIVHTRKALPAVLPVNFRLDHDGAVVLRTAAASELARAVDGAVVAFEADAVDAVAQAGWSVVVTGRAEVVTDEAELRRLDRIGLCSWVPSPEEVYVRIEPELVSGRELLAGHTMYGVHLSA
ncbi:pyridoxamine 5'-phosphate oxidase family protein [Streptomyces sp. NPDC001093]|uniref:pyridoxamine 5'-phosphate oxidase family protein n=1 Tax=Streptomyces sp. NPDC001093 TaxID=3154376 RepID=UPI003320B000